ncbi:MAG: MoaD/ThiS family protein, partial [Thaumarchaeota archaeon]|nr:MoaD/ThiS family protein [Nitrososphaerota archaeon]
LEDGASIIDLVRMLLTRYGEALGDTNQYIFSVGGKHVETTHNLREGDVVSIYPPMAGG